MITVDMPDGTKHTVRKLLTSPKKEMKFSEEYIQAHPGWASWFAKRGGSGGNTKISKGDGFDVGYIDVGLSLAPNDQSGYSVCPNSTPGCRASCVYNGGIAGAFRHIRPAQMAKTRAFFQQRKAFDAMLLQELTYYSERHPHLVCRLNVYSDLPWERMTPWLFEKLPQVQFYDYTKIVHRMLSYCSKNFPPNYHLTFSRSEVNEKDCINVLECGGSVAVVFPRGQFPETYFGHKVIDGDVNDLRFLDPDPCIVGLYAKNVFGRRDKTGFVVRLL